MSRQLALSSALSVLMMASYVLFGSDAARRPLGPVEATSPSHSAFSLLPQAEALLR